MSNRINSGRKISPVHSRWVPIEQHPDFSALSETFNTLAGRYGDPYVAIEKLKGRLMLKADSDGAPVVLAKL